MSFDPTDPSMSKPTIPGQGHTPGGPWPWPKPDPFPDPTPTVPPYFTLPPLTKPGLLDWGDMRAPFTSRGLRLTDRDIQVMEQNWWTTYNFLRGLGLRPELAALGANKGTAFAYDGVLSGELPNMADKFERDFDKQLSIQNPGQKGLGTKIVPITPLLEWVSKKIFKKGLDFSF
jgi:hypothetical protein